MKNLNLKSSAILALLVVSLNVFGVPVVDKKEAKHDVKVGINPHFLVGISSTSEITLQPAAPEVAGDGLNFDAESATNNSKWLNYSSIIKETANSISVEFDGDELPEGVTIELVASSDAGNGIGEVGTSSKDPIVLSTKAQTLISGIKNCYTGNGENAGHQLTYSLKMDQTSENYKALTSGSFSTTVIYTITEK